jgi:transposase-like protein
LIFVEIKDILQSMKRPKSPILAALRNASISEPLAVAFFEQHRWAGKPVCPRCGAENVYMMKSVDGSRNKDYRWRCLGCRKMFTVRIGTVLEETRLPLRVWAFAFWQACASKKGISALQLARETEITHKSALFVLRRIRHGVSYESVAVEAPKLQGVVEVDETFTGGRRRGDKRGRPSRDSHKAAVLGMVERGGNVRLAQMGRLTSEQIGRVLVENADHTCRVITDEYTAYRRAVRGFSGGHEFVTHSKDEYVRVGTDIHTNTIEGVFSLFKRGVMGTFHSISKKHLPNYLNEFEFRYNTRKVNDAERVSRAIKQVEGKRLKYRESVDNPPYLVQPQQPGAPF